MDNNLTSKIRIHLFTQDKCFGPGICEVLQKVDEFGSLRGAAMDMNMAYSKAWKMIKSCESALGFKLLDSSTGGKNGGGAQLTDNAKKFLCAYIQCRTEIVEFSEKIIEEKFQFYKNI